VRWYEYPRPLVAFETFRGFLFSLGLVGLGVYCLVIGNTPGRILGLAIIVFAICAGRSYVKGFAKRFAKPS
jgi:hypothetical protein